MFFMPIKSAIITFYCAFVFIEMLNRKISTHLLVPISYIWNERHFDSLSCLFICLPVAVSSIFVYVICIEKNQTTYAHTREREWKKLQTCTIYFKSINSQIDCYDCRFFFLSLCQSFTFIRCCTIEYVSMYHESNSFFILRICHLYWTEMHSIFVNRPF